MSRTPPREREVPKVIKGWGVVCANTIERAYRAGFRDGQQINDHLKSFLLEHGDELVQMLHGRVESNDEQALLEQFKHLIGELSIADGGGPAAIEDRTDR